LLCFFEDKWCQSMIVECNDWTLLIAAVIVMASVSIAVNKINYKTTIGSMIRAISSAARGRGGLASSSATALEASRTMSSGRQRRSGAGDGIPEFADAKEMYTSMVQETKSASPIRNFVGVIRSMQHPKFVVETDLFPADALRFYTRHNLALLDPDKDRDQYTRYYSSQRGGDQGDYREHIQAKIDNVIDALRRYPNSKRAVLTIPFATRLSWQVTHDMDADAKCLRELHFYLDSATAATGPTTTTTKSVARPPSPPAKQQHVLSCSGFMRAQAAEIFPKNIHYIGTIMDVIAKELKVPVGSYTHFVTTLVANRQQ